MKMPARRPALCCPSGDDVPSSRDDLLRGREAGLVPCRSATGIAEEYIRPVFAYDPNGAPRTLIHPSERMIDKHIRAGNIGGEFRYRSAARRYDRRLHVMEIRSAYLSFGIDRIEDFANEVE